VHQTGDKGLEATAKRYADAGVTADTRAFIKDMASAYHRADVIIGRAGATPSPSSRSPARPAIFIPYPFAADNHQEINAREMATAGAALSFKAVELTRDDPRRRAPPALTDPAKRHRRWAPR